MSSSALPGAMEKQYRGFCIQVDEDFTQGFPFTVSWTDGEVRYFPLPKETRFKTPTAAFAAACQLIDVQYEAEAQGACVHFNSGVSR